MQSFNDTFTFTSTIELSCPQDNIRGDFLSIFLLSWTAIGILNSIQHQPDHTAVAKSFLKN